jgi:hypothetical protein
MKPEHLELTLIKLDNSLSTYCEQYNINDNIDVIFLGSQSILFYHQNIKNNIIIQSYEVDIVLSFNQELKKHFKKELELILNNLDSAYGYGSNLHDSEDFYIDNMTEIDDDKEHTKKWPINWLNRAYITQKENKKIKFICLDKHDVTILKLIANREKDLEYVQTLIQGSLLKKKKLFRILKECNHIIDNKRMSFIKKKIRYFYSLPQLNILNK